MPPASPSAVDHFPLDTVAIFAAVFAFSLFVDLVQHRGRKQITARDAGLWSIFWVALSLAFYGWITYRHGSAWGSMFLTGYVLEKTLSVDNLMVFIAVFKFFRIESGLQHRVLYWGILGAIFFRFVFVVIGTGFLAVAGPWALLVFGAFVLWAAIQMLRGGDDDEEEHPKYEEMGLVKFFRRFYPVFPNLVGDRFFINRKEAEEAAAHDSRISLPAGVVRFMTPAFVCLLVIEGSDVLFSFDSVPAVIAATQEPLLVYTAMIFAILGLRSLYFILLVLTKYLAHLEKAIIYVLFFIGAKMFLEAYHKFHELGWFPELPFHISPNVSMVVVFTMLGLGVIASFIWPAKDDAAS